MGEPPVSLLIAEGSFGGAAFSNSAVSATI